jgi:hypothetical protein
MLDLSNPERFEKAKKCLKDLELEIQEKILGGTNG